MKRLIGDSVMALFFCSLSLIAIAAPLAVKLGDYSGGIMERLEQFISEFNGLLASLGTIFLILGMGVWTTHLSNRSASARQRADRLTSAELKIAEFRQAWIDRLRQDLADVVVLAGIDHIGNKTEDLSEKIQKLRRLDSLIRLRLNPNEDKAKTLEEAVRKVVDLFDLSTKGDANASKCIIGAREHLAKLSAEYLKNEWEVVKEVLEKAKEDSL